MNLDEIGPKLKKSLDPTTPDLSEKLKRFEKAPWRFGRYGFEKEGGPESWIDYYAGAIGRVLYDLKWYTILDLGCNVGAKSPFLTAWGCRIYRGLDNRQEYIDIAQERWGSGFIYFEKRDIIHHSLPTGYDVAFSSYVLQHFPISWKRKFLTNIAAVKPKALILVDYSIRDKTIEECEKEHEIKGERAMQVPTPIGLFEETMPGYEVENVAGILYVVRRK